MTSTPVQSNASSFAIIPIHQNQPTSTLETMPYDVLRLVFDYFTPCIATCFGLTNKKHYRVLKTLYPNPISLLEQACSHGEPCFVPGHPCPRWDTPLSKLLKEWSVFGTQYRFAVVGAGVVRFLNIGVYGDSEGSEAQRRLEARYHDYQMTAEAYEPSPWVRPQLHFGDPNPVSLLPRPYNKGEDWYQEAIEAIRRDSLNSPFAEKWGSYWFCREIFQEYILQNFQEWRALVNL